jgi:4-carboxymuconolactone decarboxylase
VIPFRQKEGEPNMPRLPEVLERDALPEDHRAVYDYLTKTRGAVRLPFSALLLSPDITQRVAHVGTYCRFESGLPDKVRELAVITAVREREVAFEWAAHLRMAGEVGVSKEAIEAVTNKGPLDKLSDEEQLPIQFAREVLVDKHVSDATFDEARKRFGDKGIIDLTATVGYYAMLGCLLNTMEVEPPEGAPRLP